MTIGAKDYIDHALVRKYANVRVDSIDTTNVSKLAVSADKMLQTMNDYADVQRNMLSLHNKMKNICKGVNLMNAYQRV
jgi:hypothetical protein